jgi:hypothetical protein
VNPDTEWVCENCGAQLPMHGQRTAVPPGRSESGNGNTSPDKLQSNNTFHMPKSTWKFLLIVFVLGIVFDLIDPYQRHRLVPLDFVIWLSGLGFTLYALSRRQVSRPLQEGLSPWQRIAALCFPLLLVVLCIVFSSPTANSPVPLWFAILLTLAVIALFFCGSEARWIGVPLKIRQTSDYVMWGIVLSFIVMIVVTAVLT